MHRRITICMITVGPWEQLINTGSRWPGILKLLLTEFLSGVQQLAV